MMGIVGGVASGARRIKGRWRKEGRWEKGRCRERQAMQCSHQCTEADDRATTSKQQATQA
jgi:hypothetical protein